MQTKQTKNGTKILLKLKKKKINKGKKSRIEMKKRNSFKPKEKQNLLCCFIYIPNGILEQHLFGIANFLFKAHACAQIISQMLDIRRIYLNNLN